MKKNVLKIVFVFAFVLSAVFLISVSDVYATSDEVQKSGLTVIIDDVGEVLSEQDEIALKTELEEQYGDFEYNVLLLTVPENAYGGISHWAGMYRKENYSDLSDIITLAVGPINGTMFANIRGSSRNYFNDYYENSACEAAYPALKEGNVAESLKIMAQYYLDRCVECSKSEEMVFVPHETITDTSQNVESSAQKAPSNELAEKIFDNVEERARFIVSMCWMSVIALSIDVGIIVRLVRKHKFEATSNLSGFAWLIKRGEKKKRRKFEMIGTTMTSYSILSDTVRKRLL